MMICRIETIDLTCRPCDNLPSWWPTNTYGIPCRHNRKQSYTKSWWCITTSWWQSNIWPKVQMCCLRKGNVETLRRRRWQSVMKDMDLAHRCTGPDPASLIRSALFTLPVWQMRKTEMMQINILVMLWFRLTRALLRSSFNPVVTALALTSRVTW